MRILFFFFFFFFFIFCSVDLARSILRKIVCEQVIFYLLNSLFMNVHSRIMLSFVICVCKLSQFGAVFSVVKAAGRWNLHVVYE